MSITRRQITRLLLVSPVASLPALTPRFAAAQAAWPNRPIRLIVPYTPGGFTDNVARIVSVKLSERLGQPVTIENKPGANSIIGVDALAKSAPDGYTLAVVIAAYAANTTLYPKLPYNPARDLQAVSLIGISPLVAAVNNDTPHKNAKDLIVYARANPGKISFGSSGNGSAAHLTTEFLKAQTKTFMVHIPYRGAAPAMTDLMGGQIQLLFDAASGMIGPGKSGKVRLIGVAADRRLPVLADVPTFIEQGFANFTGSTWAGMLAPAGTPADIVQKLADEVTRIVRTDDVRARFDQIGTFAVGGTPEEFARFIGEETTKWGKVIRDANVSPDS